MKRTNLFNSNYGKAKRLSQRTKSEPKDIEKIDKKISLAANIKRFRFMPSVIISKKRKEIIVTMPILNGSDSFPA